MPRTRDVDRTLSVSPPRPHLMKIFVQSKGIPQRGDARAMREVHAHTDGPTPVRRAAEASGKPKPTAAVSSLEGATPANHRSELMRDSHPCAAGRVPRAGMLSRSQRCSQQREFQPIRD